MSFVSKFLGMGDNGDTKSSLVVHGKRVDSLCPILFGVSCAFFALGLLPEEEEQEQRIAKWLDVKNKLLLGSAHLLGMLVWSVQRIEIEINSVKTEIFRKLEVAKLEIEELKHRRREDARANEKVVSIFAAQEQVWLSERRNMRQQIGSLLNELRVVRTKKEESLSELNKKLQEKELLLQTKEGTLDQVQKKRRELEEKLIEVEKVAADLREAAKKECQEHSSELWKHKSAFIEIVSNQRQIEAELGRAKQELNMVFEQKEESDAIAQNLSLELMKAQKDLEQKENILSALLRKSKLDADEKQMLFKEVKLSKARRKEAEVETERWRAVSVSGRERQSLRSMLSLHSSTTHSKSLFASPSGRSKARQSSFLLDHEHTDHKRDGIDEMVDARQLKEWVRSETQKYTTLVEQRHCQEINAFAEQLRLKDDKLEPLRWRLLSMELESKRLQSKIEVLNYDMSQIRQDNLKLDALLSDREAEISSLKDQLMSQLSSPSHQKTSHTLPLGKETIWSEVKIVKKIPEEKQEGEKPTSAEITQEMESQKYEEPSNKSQCRDIVLAVNSPEKESDEEKDVLLDPGSIREAPANRSEIEVVEKPASTWKMDLHALGVSYKIKRLKQQLLLLERLSGKSEFSEGSEGGCSVTIETKGFHVRLTFLNKQVSRYQTLQGKIDELCRRMHDSDMETRHSGCNLRKTREETRTLGNFLEETFQLQRYIVATGQKMNGIQSKIDGAFVEAVEEELDRSASVDMKRFADSIRTLFKEAQRGLEVRIARIIGDLEGTLACDGIKNLRF